ncbi:MAG: hypothetical protein R8P61_36415 [Bacteroidia bacterium]|nr:hypothetical protein [Bacteroidia bacterium]
MKSLSIGLGIALSLLILLLTTSILLQNPEQKKYQQTLKAFEEQTGIQSETELLSQFPQLEALKKQIGKLERMNGKVQNQMKDPMPMSSEESWKLKEQIQSIQLLRRDINSMVKIVSSTLPNISPYARN